MKDKKPKKSITIGGLKLQIKENPKKIENKLKTNTTNTTISGVIFNETLSS